MNGGNESSKIAACLASALKPSLVIVCWDNCAVLRTVDNIQAATGLNEKYASSLSIALNDCMANASKMVAREHSYCSKAIN